MMKNEKLGSHPHKLSGQIFRIFIVSYILSVIVLTLTVKLVLQFQLKNDLQILQATEGNKVETVKDVLESRVEIIASTLRTLSNAPPMLSLIKNKSDDDVQQAANHLVDFSKHQKIFDQIRYINEQGMEIIRVDYTKQHATIIDAEHLQNKSGRYFFKDAMKLHAGEVYVSPLDLSIENNKIEVPYKPVIRFATPVFSEDGQHRGLVMISLSGDHLIHTFKELMDNPHRGQAMLVSRDADWLVSPNPQKEWGFMFGQSGQFAKDYPDVWAHIHHKPRGIYQNNLGLFTYTTVQPLRNGEHSADGSPLPLGSSNQAYHQNDYYWKIISYIPADALPSASIQHNVLVFRIYMAGLVLSFPAMVYLSYIIATRRKLRQDLQHKNAYLLQISHNLGEGLAVLNAEGKIVDLNPEGERLLHWHREELLGRDAHDSFHSGVKDDLVNDKEHCPILAVSKTGTRYSNDDEVFYRNDGSELPVSVIVAPLKNDEQLVGSVVSFRDMTEVKKYQLEVHQLAYHDALTGLANRRLLIDHIDLSIGLAERNQHKLAVLFLDLDKFKLVNDTYGHEGGDDLLKGIASRLLQQVRKTDTVSRQGGDEFVILLNEVGAEEDAVLVAKNILQAFHAAPFLVQEHPIAAYVSIGIAVYPEHGTTAEALLQAADSAMYEAKKTGTNHYCLFGDIPKNSAS